ncbi:MAG: DUF1501 domain-containing protein [Planctomycetota bacterium]
MKSPSDSAGPGPMPCLSRRGLLRAGSCGFGLVAAQSLLGASRPNPTGPRQPGPDFAPRARSVIFCYMSGGVSHVDSFDPKPELERRAGQPMPFPVERTQFNNNGTIRPSYWRFRPRGDSGIEVSDLFPHLGNCVDKMTVIRSMTAPFSEHAQGNLFAHTGFPFLGHPSAGAWMGYGLGSAAEDLPGYVVLQSGGAAAPHGGVANFTSGFLPGQHEASVLRADAEEAVRNVRAVDHDALQRRRLRFVDQLDAGFASDLGPGYPALQAAIKNQEIAYRMQAAVPDLCDLHDEPDEVRTLYGLDHGDRRTAAYARQCLLARRLVERGVRFIELSTLGANLGGGNAANPWDHHSSLERGHGLMAGQVDQPIAALLLDLDRRGLLDETLVVFAGEFGRTPFSQGSDGRDHNPYGFSIWLAGGGVRRGHVHGATDELGYRAVEDVCTYYDLWATVLHLLGLDHERLTFRFGGRDYRLTDVHGRVMGGVLA